MARPVRLAFYRPEVGLPIRLAAIGQKRTFPPVPTAGIGLPLRQQPVARWSNISCEQRRRSQAQGLLQPPTCEPSECLSWANSTGRDRSISKRLTKSMPTDGGRAL